MQIRGKKQYWVKWVGYDDETDNTWEPVENLDACEELIAKFEASEAERMKALA